MRRLNPRIWRWPRFVEIADDFKQTFGDVGSRVGSKSSLHAFETRNRIHIWEWKTIYSLVTEGDYIPAPHSVESLDVYLLIFKGHVDYKHLVHMRKGRHAAADRDRVVRHGACMDSLRDRYTCGE